MTSITERIESLVAKVNHKVPSARVFWFGAPEKVNQALGQATEEERFSLAVDLFALWIEGGLRQKPDLKEAVEQTFGDLAKQFSRERLMFTLTGDSKQLRVWYGLPGTMTYDHVDSCGGNLLLEVCGDPQVLPRYVSGFLQTYPLRGNIRVPNGVSLWMSWGNK